MWEDPAGEEESPPHVDAIHQVKALLVQSVDSKSVVRRGVVHKHVNPPAESADHRLDSLADLRGAAQVAGHGEPLAADRFDLLHHV